MFHFVYFCSTRCCRDDLLMKLSPLAHSRRCRRRWPVPGVSWIVPGGFPRHPLHRMQRSPRDLPLLCQQIQFLADHRGTNPTVCGRTHLGNPESRAAPNTGRPMPSVHEELVARAPKWPTPMKKHKFERRPRNTAPFLAMVMPLRTPQSQDFSTTEGGQSPFGTLYILIPEYGATFSFGIHGYLRKSFCEPFPVDASDYTDFCLAYQTSF